jgi:hypothetical protein
MENIREMRLRHKLEIAALETKCSHLNTEEVQTEFERRTVCVFCGKIIKRNRNFYRI